MNLKRFMPLCLFCALATGLGAETDPLSADGWQVAQVQIPLRHVATGTPTNTPASATASPRTPVGPPSPHLPAMSGLPSTPAVPPLATPPFTGPATNAISTEAEGDKADISYTFPAIPVEQLLDI